jgi:hypothetical protein
MTRIDVKHTLKTRQKEALRLPLGFWCKKPVELTREKVCELLQADVKRKRENYDSYSLFEQRKNVSSEPYIMDEILLDPNFNYPPKSVDAFAYEKINRFFRLKRFWL